MTINFFAFFASAHAEVLVSLFIIFTAAKLAAEVFERLKQPAVVGEILAGVLIGPSVLALVKQSDFTNAMAEIGVILLLFTVGLEINPGALFKVGGKVLLTAVLGVVIPFIAGWLLMYLWGANTIESVFIGAAMVATSVGITARVLAAMNMLSTRSSQIIMGAAVIDDILGLLVLSVVSSVAKGGVRYGELLTTAALSIGFTLFIVFVGAKLTKRAKPRVEKLRINHPFFISGMILCLGLSLLASYVGVAAIIGAFLAGMALSEVSEDTDLHHKASAVTEFLVPFFLVNIGLQLDLKVFANINVIMLALIVTVVAVITKLVGCGIAALPLGRRAALQIGMGMVPRGEVGIIVAQIGMGLGVLSGSLYAVIVSMAVATTLIAPPFLTRLFSSADLVPTNLVPAEEETVIEQDQTLSALE